MATDKDKIKIIESLIPQFIKNIEENNAKEYCKFLNSKLVGEEKLIMVIAELEQLLKNIEAKPSSIENIKIDIKKQCDLVKNFINP